MMSPYGKLYLLPSPLAPDTLEQCATPVLREVIASLDYFVVEELRTVRRFVSSLKLGKVIENLHFYELNKQSTIASLEEVCQLLKAGKSFGMISEAGCPAVADPGQVLVAWAQSQGIVVEPLVGASSIMLALMASGFNGQKFSFHGYLPIERQEREKTLLILEKEAIQKHYTQIFMETPFRNNQMLDSILKSCQPDTKLCIACQLTAPEGFVQTRSIAAWRKQKIDLHKKPTIFILGV